MNLDRESAAARGLRRYVELVAEAVGIGADASATQFDDPVNVYLPLERCATAYPEHDLALIWDERYGWMLAIEVPGTVQLTVLGYLADTLLPTPPVVAEYVTRACSGAGFGQARPERHARPTDDDLADRLAAYAGRVYGASWYRLSATVTDQPRTAASTVG
ncbi:MAG TPA: DUF6292 family protein [Pseudonocardiaceae bacterium]|jgi:hypothetical protein|nr:DUF6292 family protein [Pseudonocardiaceae bacterium]